MSKREEYLNFASLQKGEREGVNFTIAVAERQSPVAVIAPHGGAIEPATERIAAAIAHEDFSFYCFRAIAAADPSKTLHITSDRFDEPRCQALVAKSDKIISVHGLKDTDKAFIDVGGLDTVLRDAICRSLSQAGFVAIPVSRGAHAGVSPRNICNRGKQNMGIQLEISRALRDSLTGDALQRFAAAIRSAVGESGSSN